MNKIRIRVQGFFKGMRRVNEEYALIGNTRDITRGFQLDEIEIHTKLTTVKDIDQLIEFLNNSKPCFK
jgi:hypothetical protein